VILGLDAKLAETSGFLDGKAQNERHDHGHEHDHGHSSEVEVLSVALTSDKQGAGVDLARLENFLFQAPKDEIYRIKAILYASDIPVSSTGDRAMSLEAHEQATTPTRYILNWAFMRWTYTVAPSEGGSNEPVVRMTVMAAPSELTKWRKRIEAGEFVALEGDAAGAELRVEKIS